MANPGSQQLKGIPPKAKYEMNLAEFPISILAKRPSKGSPKELKSIEYEDTIVGKNGKAIPRRWKVSPSIEYGFGSSEIIGTLFELFQIWKEQGFETCTIQFGSVYSLIKRLGIKDEATAYDRLRRDLNALVDIGIEAKNAFWDNEKKVYVDKKFHLFDSLTTYHERVDGQRPLPFASIKASDEVWGSVQANALITTSFGSEWFHSLSPTEKRLSLYLTKMLHSQPVHKREVTKLGAQLPLLAQSYKKVKQQLTLCAQGLLDKGYPPLASFYYEKKRRGESDIIVFVGKATPRRKETARQIPRTGRGGEREEFFVDRARLDAKELDLLDRILEVCGDRNSEANYLKVTRTYPVSLIEMTISETRQADREGRIEATRGAYFMDTLKRLAEMRSKATKQI
jgi:hypothetical protein